MGNARPDSQVDRGDRRGAIGLGDGRVVAERVFVRAAAGPAAGEAAELERDRGDGERARAHRDRRLRGEERGGQRLGRRLVAPQDELEGRIEPVAFLDRRFHGYLSLCEELGLSWTIFLRGMYVALVVVSGMATPQLWRRFMNV